MNYSIRKTPLTEQMKRTYVVLLAVSIAACLWGCQAKETNSANTVPPSSSGSSANSNPATAASSGANTNAATSTSSAATPRTPATKPLGTYEWREVEDDKGVVTIITKVKTTMVFRNDGSYSRISQLGTKTYHSDSGRFSIEGTDKLTLTIQVSQKNIQTPAINKSFKFSISPDGDRLKLTNEKKGSTAIYQRTAAPPGAS